MTQVDSLRRQDTSGELPARESSVARPVTDGAVEAETAAVDWPAELAAAERWLRTVVLARTGERQAVDEVMQEVALAVVRQRTTLADPTKAAPWLYRLAVRQSLLFRRKMGRKRRLEQRFGEQRRPVESESRTRDPLNYLLAEERQQRVRDAMQRIGKRDAEILMLKYAENWSYQQIAEHLGATASAVESRLHRARAQLRGQLTALDVDAAETARVTV